MSLNDLASEVERARATKANLEALKAKNAKTFTEQQQNDLNSVTLYLVDAEEILEQKQAKAEKPAEAAGTYVPVKGTETLVHVQLAKGRRFDSTTGEEITKAYVQTFTFGEWQLFEKNSARLGYTVIKVLHNPYAVK